jgi:hypothetical protein
MTAETQKMIQRVKRSNNPMFKIGRPERTLKILQKQDQNHVKKAGKTKFNLNANFIDLKGVGEGESISIVKKMKMLEEQFMSTHHNSEGMSKSQPHKQSKQILSPYESADPPQ